MRIGHVLIVVFIALVLSPPSAFTQVRLDPSIERTMRELLPFSDDTVRILGLANPANCLKCDVVLQALIDSIRSCTAKLEYTRSGQLVAVGREAELRSLRRRYPSETLLVPDVRKRLWLMLSVDARGRCIVVYKHHAWLVTEGDKFCTWARDLRSSK